MLVNIAEYTKHVKYLLLYSEYIIQKMTWGQTKASTHAPVNPLGNAR